MAPVLVLLPGLDGTGQLFDRFQHIVELETRVVRYPTDQLLGYSELEQVVMSALPAEEPFILVAESFSGPLAIRLAAKEVTGLVGTILVASFARCPMKLPLLTEHLLPVFFSLPPPRSLIRRLLVGRDAPRELVDAVGAAVRSVRSSVFAHRVREIINVDVTTELRALSGPLLYLRAASDGLVPASVGDEMKEVNSALEIEDIEAPHLVLQRAPLKAADAIAAFANAARHGRSRVVGS